ncbi:MAG TPA: NDP-sugar synthase [Acidimicrobiales bacterium]|nr:NDP-sugar synthase [Acidimicrobiales bacterium]
MRAVVLVGGFGTRLRPLTDTIPKPLLPVGHRAILELVLCNLARAGLDAAVLSLGFRSDAFARAFPDGSCAGVRLAYAVEPEPLDTAGAIAFAARQAGIDERFVVVNGDVLTDLDVRQLVRTHEQHGARATIHLTPVDDPSAFGVAEVAADGRVLRFVEKPPRDSAPSNLVNAGTYLFEPDVLDLIPAGGPISVERETFPRLVRDGTLYAVATDDYWTDTGRPELYLRANIDMISGARAWMRSDAVASGAIVAASARLERSVVASGVQIDDDASVSGSVVLDGTTVRRGAEIVDSILGPGCAVGEGALVSGSVLGAGATVAAGDQLRDARRPQPG